MGAVTGWRRTGWLSSGSLGREHKGKAGIDSLQSSPVSQTCPCGSWDPHVAHSLHTNPIVCQPVLCWEGLTWGTDSCSSSSGSHMSVSSGFLPIFLKWNPNKGSAYVEEEKWEQLPALTTSPISSSSPPLRLWMGMVPLFLAGCLCRSLTTGMQQPVSLSLARKSRGCYAAQTAHPSHCVPCLKMPLPAI